ncbi:hypothetical protein D3C76_1850210 [compost metagenome]
MPGTVDQKSPFNQFNINLVQVKCNDFMVLAVAHRFIVDFYKRIADLKNINQAEYQKHCTQAGQHE